MYVQDEDSRWLGLILYLTKPMLKIFPSNFALKAFPTLSVSGCFSFFKLISGFCSQKPGQEVQPLLSKTRFWWVCTFGVAPVRKWRHLKLRGSPSKCCHPSLTCGMFRAVASQGGRYSNPPGAGKNGKIFTLIFLMYPFEFYFCRLHALQNNCTVIYV